jgi:hypothetical protein
MKRLALLGFAEGLADAIALRFPQRALHQAARQDIAPTLKNFEDNLSPYPVTQ